MHFKKPIPASHLFSRLKRTLILVLPIFLISCGEQLEPKDPQPNIVFVFADDMTYTAIQALGNSEIQTPNLDRLVHNGTTFTHAYNMGAWNGAVCVASRAMIISGRSVWNANQFRKNWINGAALDQTWGRIMEKNGYETYMTGKWHVDAKADSVFKNVVHIRPGMPRDAWGTAGMGQRFKDIKGTNKPISSIMPVGYNRPLDENDTIWTPTDTKFGGFWEGGKHWSEVLKDDALRFIKDAKEKKNPFFMYLAFNAPHDPRQAPQEYLDKYPLDNIGLPKSWLPEYPFKDSIGNGPGLRDEALAPFPRTAYAIKKHKQEYYALITHLDDQIGEILDAVKDVDNTYVIFTADHGLSVGRHGLLGKQSLFDHSVRVPFMIMGPKIPKDKKISADIYLQDAMATSLDLAGINKPDYVYFNSVMDLVDGSQEHSNYEAIYGGYTKLQRMIRKDGYKLIVYPKLNKILLFNLSEDPEEMQDLAGEDQHQELKNSLLDELIQMQKDLNDPLVLNLN